jgi:hypothetical protein
MSHKLESWGRGDLVKEVVALRAEREELRVKVSVLQREVAALKEAAKARALPCQSGAERPSTAGKGGEETGGSAVRFPDCQGLAATEMGLKVRFADGSEEWMPSSQVHEDSEVYAAGHEGALVVKRWLAIQRGWI